MKKKWMALLLAAVMVMGLAACGGGKDAETADSDGEGTEETADGEKTQGGGELVVYSPNSEGLINATIPLFEEKYGVDVMTMVGFLDGIDESLKEANPIDTMEEDTPVSLDFDKEKLYYNMVEARASWLYELPQWDALLTPERRKELYKEQKSSTTIVKGKKIGRNDPCPCGSGKKYKYCCGRNA